MLKDSPDFFWFIRRDVRVDLLIEKIAIYSLHFFDGDMTHYRWVLNIRMYVFTCNRMYTLSLHMKYKYNRVPVRRRNNLC